MIENCKASLPKTNVDDANTYLYEMGSGNDVDMATLQLFHSNKKQANIDFFRFLRGNTGR